MIFHLASNGERSVITDHFNGLREQSDGPFFSRETVEAEGWLEAKVAFGFDLTSLQTEMLPLNQAEREALQRWRV